MPTSFSVRKPTAFWLETPLAEQSLAPAHCPKVTLSLASPNLLTVSLLSMLLTSGKSTKRPSRSRWNLVTLKNLTRCQSMLAILLLLIRMSSAAATTLASPSALSTKRQSICRLLNIHLASLTALKLPFQPLLLTIMEKPQAKISKFATRISEIW